MKRAYSKFVELSSVRYVGDVAGVDELHEICLFRRQHHHPAPFMGHPLLLIGDATSAVLVSKEDILGVQRRGFSLVEGKSVEGHCSITDTPLKH